MPSNDLSPTPAPNCQTTTTINHKPQLLGFYQETYACYLILLAIILTVKIPYPFLPLTLALALRRDFNPAFPNSRASIFVYGAVHALVGRFALETVADAMVPVSIRKMVDGRVVRRKLVVLAVMGVVVLVEVMGWRWDGGALDGILEFLNVF